MHDFSKFFFKFSKIHTKKAYKTDFKNYLATASWLQPFD